METQESSHEREWGLVWWLPVALQISAIIVTTILAILVAVVSTYMVSEIERGREAREEIKRRIERVERIAPCDGCFESLRWRVDELRALHGIIAKEAKDEADPKEEGQEDPVQPASGGGG